MKTIEQNFADWEGHAFGFGYGTGEAHTLRALKGFFDALGREEMPDLPNAYNYEKLEEALTAPVAWLLINILCHNDIIEYGTSPRYGWLTAEGEALRKFVDAHTVGELEDICCRTEDEVACYPDACNCGPEGYQEGVKCHNPFWRWHH